MANDDRDEEIQIAYRLPKTIIRAVDREIERREKEQPGVRISRAELSRIAMLKLLNDDKDSESTTGSKRKAG